MRWVAGMNKNPGPLTGAFKQEPGHRRMRIVGIPDGSVPWSELGPEGIPPLHDAPSASLVNIVPGAGRFAHVSDESRDWLAVPVRLIRSVRSFLVVIALNPKPRDEQLPAVPGDLN